MLTIFHLVTLSRMSAISPFRSALFLNCPQCAAFCSGFFSGLEKLVNSDSVKPENVTIETAGLEPYSRPIVIEYSHLPSFFRR